MSEDILRDEHRRLQRDARENRKRFAAAPLGQFAKTMIEALGDYFKARAAGVSREDACKGLEAVLRDAWPGKPTKYPPQCDVCDDTGWQIKTCWHEQRCPRNNCRDRHPAQEHSYAVSCACVKGDRFRRQAQTLDDELAAVGRTQRAAKAKSRPMTRFGV